MKVEIMELLKKGHLREFLSEKGRQTYGLKDESKEGGSCSASRKVHHHH